jgi:hypothetical protein
MSYSVVPANEASWEDIQTVFGRRGDPQAASASASR